MNYAAIIGDIKDSKKIENRNQVQEKLNSVLKQVNEAYYTDISAKFVIPWEMNFRGCWKAANIFLI